MPNICYYGASSPWLVEFSIVSEVTGREVGFISLCLCSLNCVRMTRGNREATGDCGRQNNGHPQMPIYGSLNLNTRCK